MKKLGLLFVICLITTLSFAQNLDDEKSAIKKVIQTAYVEGLQNEGDLKKIDSGVHPEFNLLGISEDGKLWKLPIDEWKQRVIKGMKAGEYPRKGDKMVSIEFLNIDITGTAAVASFEFYIGKEKKYVDYISLYKFDDGWKMVSKIYYQFKD